MEMFGDTFNYYPRIMIQFSEIAYESLEKIPEAVAKLGWEVCWGPHELVSEFDIAFSAMYVARRPQPNEYAVVIRGTNFDSLEAWFKQDFDIGTKKPFSDFVPNAPADALISHGTYNGLKDLVEKMVDQEKGNLLTYLKHANPKPGRLYVTGHSLGGTLVPPMFAYLNGLLNTDGPGSFAAMHPFSFAGLTSGDDGFNAYLMDMFSSKAPWRLHNTLDIAPFCWWSLDQIKDIYLPWKLDWSFVEEVPLNALFRDAQEAGGYAQPKTGGAPLSGNFDDSFFDEHLWSVQALHQHHPSTYQKLVFEAFSP